jgi:hypothetical protein
MVYPVEVEFAGLCAVVHRAGSDNADVVLLDPRSVGGGTHSPCLVTPIDEEEPSVPDEAFYGSDGVEYGFWSLRGAVVTFPLAEDEFSADISPIGTAPVRPDDPGLWRSLRWLPEFFGPSRASHLVQSALWPSQARVAVNRGLLVGKMPHKVNERTDLLTFKTPAGLPVTDPRARATSCALEFREPVTIVIDSPIGRRRIRVREKAVISNTAATSGGHEDTAVLTMLGGDQLRDIRREVQSLAPIVTNPDICDPPLILLP